MICEFCKKEYELTDNKYASKRFCCSYCKGKDYLKREPKRYKENNKRYVNNHIIDVRKRWNNWANKNKDKLREKGRIKVLKWYHNKDNNHKMCEIIFVNTHRPIFLELLGNKCLFCNSKKIMFHHKRYDLSHLDYYEYSRCLVPLCKQHHKDVHCNKVSLLN